MALCGFEMFMALAHGKMHGRRGGWIYFADHPIMFSGVFLLILFVFAMSACFFCFWLDEGLKKYGGTYKLRHILRVFRDEFR